MISLDQRDHPRKRYVSVFYTFIARIVEPRTLKISRQCQCQSHTIEVGFVAYSSPRCYQDDGFSGISPWSLDDTVDVLSRMHVHSGPILVILRCNSQARFPKDILQLLRDPISNQRPGYGEQIVNSPSLQTLPTLSHKYFIFFKKDFLVVFPSF